MIDTVTRSDIPKARALLEECLETCNLGPHSGALISKALTLMTRAKAVRRARTQHHRSIVTEEQKRGIRKLAKDRALTCAQIAEHVGLPSSASGRVSEVLHGLR